MTDTPWSLIAMLMVLLATYLIVKAIYNLLFHPLARFPGPKARAVSELPWVISGISGKIPHSVKELHRIYGDVVRVGPNTLSFVAPEAWRDIYGHGNVRNFPKYNYPKTKDGTDSLLTADHIDHPRQRKTVNRAFSDKALKAQGPVIKIHIDKLMAHFRNIAAGEQNGVVDVVKWFNYASFDLIGELAFGEGLGCLEKEEFRSSVTAIIDFNKSTALIEEALKFPVLTKLITWFIPKRIVEERARHISMSMQKLHSRLASQEDRTDFWSYILEPTDKNCDMSVQEMEANAALFLLAGSDSTATALSGALYHICKNPLVMQKLQLEIRSSFTNEESIDVLIAQNLQFLHATIQECLRVYPPFPANIPRYCTADNAIVAGHVIPRGTVVQIPIWPANTYPGNFIDADSLIPERWLDVEKYSADKKVAMQTFSIGPRNCIGQSLAWIEMKLILCHLFYNFDVELADSLFDPQQQKCFIVWEKQPLNIKLRKRV